jgi:hypothetical protein
MDGLVAPEFVEMGEAIRLHVAWIKDQLSQEPATFLHGDFHPNNMFLTRRTAGDELNVFDWQVSSRGRAARDLFYFIASALLPEERVAHEAAIVEAYHHKLVNSGVAGCPLADCRADFRLSLLDFYFFTVTVLVILDFTVNEEAVAIRDMIIDRWVGMILAHKPLDLLPN